MGRRLTTAEFVDQARAAHGDRYDYAAVAYVQRSTPVTIICPDHGVFSVLPWRHVIRRDGCPECGELAAQARQQAAAEQWIARAREIHGDRYDYSRADYRGIGHLVTIVCREHGPFLQNASSHLQGRGCQVCGRAAAAEKLREAHGGYTTAEWVERAIEVHGERYAYDLVVYQGSKAKVRIVCPDHGPFEQTASQHLTGYGCAACAREPRITQEEFVSRSRVVHSDRYDYSMTVFAGVGSKVRILCAAHGPFVQLAGNHLSGAGCPRCGVERTRLDAETFVEKATARHGDRYDYGRSEYTTARTFIRIDCRRHGPFFQRPMHHLQGHGCPHCRWPRVS